MIKSISKYSDNLSNPENNEKQYSKINLNINRTD